VIDPEDEESKPVDDELESGKFYPDVGEYSLELVSSATLETVDM
jgi:hypothetical protein